jgi:hypothetical protein
MDNETEYRWHDLRTEAPPTGERPVILFPVISDVGHRFDVRRDYHVSNPEYVRLRALEMGYTHWFPVPPHPDEAAIEARIEALYASENDARQQFDEGFKRAAENIVETLKEIVPDRPNVARVISDRFVGPKDFSRKSSPMREPR